MCDPRDENMDDWDADDWEAFISGTPKPTSRYPCIAGSELADITGVARPPGEDELDDDYDSEEEDEPDREDRDDSEEDLRMEHHGAIIEKLAASAIAKWYPVPGGFVVPRGVLVRVDAGKVVDCFSWLVEKGLGMDQEVDGWFVRLLPGMGGEPAKIVFSRSIVDLQGEQLVADLQEALARLRHGGEGGNETREDEDDIPF